MFRIDIGNHNFWNSLAELLTGMRGDGKAAAQSAAKPPATNTHPVDDIVYDLFHDRAGLVLHVVDGGYIAIDRRCSVHMPKIACFTDEESAAAYVVAQLKQRRASYEEWHADHEAFLAQRAKFADKIADGAVMVAQVMAAATANGATANGHGAPVPPPPAASSPAEESVPVDDPHA